MAAFFVFRRFYYVRFYSNIEKETKGIINKNFISNNRVSLLNYDSIPTGIEITRTNLLNTLADKFDYRSYLEIGQGKPENNFRWINCKIKIGVDPDSICNAAYCMTSDEFFEQNTSTFDLIFIDGLHEKEQVFRDVIHSLNCMNKNGTVVLHDCNPTNEAMQIVPRTQEEWTGDVWKAWVKLRSERNDVEMYVVENSNGCGIIRVGKQQTIQVPDLLTYQYLSENRRYLLNLKSINDFLSY